MGCPSRRRWRGLRRPPVRTRRRRRRCATIERTRDHESAGRTQHRQGLRFDGRDSIPKRASSACRPDERQLSPQGLEWRSLSGTRAWHAGGKTRVRVPAKVPRDGREPLLHAGALRGEGDEEELATRALACRVEAMVGRGEPHGQLAVKGPVSAGLERWSFSRERRETPGLEAPGLETRGKICGQTR